MSCNPTNQDAVLSFAMGNFPDGYCPSNYQAFANDIANALSGYLPGNFTAWSIASGDPDPVPPPPNEFAKPWLRLDPNNCGPIGVYVWSKTFGMWVSRHPIAPGTVIMYQGDEDTIPTFDGGGGGLSDTGSPNTGPMWVIVAEMAGRFPMGPGTIPGYESTPVDIPAPINSEGGASGRSIIMTEAQMATHKHKIGMESSGADESGPSESGQIRASGAATHWELDSGVHIGYTRNAGTSEPINIPTLPRYKSIWFLKKTSRVYYTYITPP